MKKDWPEANDCGAWEKKACWKEIHSSRYELKIFCKKSFKK
jgi:hypothetical protein